MMTQKSNEEIYKSLSEEERNVTVTSVELTDKAFKGKTDYSAIARLNGKVVFREGEYFSTLEGLQLFVFKNGKQITAYNWKIEDVFDWKGWASKSGSRIIQARQIGCKRPCFVGRFQGEPGVT